MSVATFDRRGRLLYLNGRKPQRKRVRVMCGRCDGCGWYEGGVVLQTGCADCRGKGFRTLTHYRYDGSWWTGPQLKTAMLAEALLRKLPWPKKEPRR